MDSSHAGHDRPTAYVEGIFCTPHAHFWEVGYIRELLAGFTLKWCTDPFSRMTAKMQVATLRGSKLSVNMSIIAPRLDGVVVLVATSILWWPLSTLEQLRRAPKGSILIHVGDENCHWGARAWEEYDRFSLVLRQYACRSAYTKRYAKHPHVYPIPLGYNTELFNPSLPVAHRALQRLQALGKSASEDFAWVLPGTLAKAHDDRLRAIRAFSNVRPHQYGPMPANETAKLSGRAHFVLSGLGNVSPDCFRHYESSISGAVPVMSLSAAAFDDAYGHFCSAPPWLRADTWADAAHAVSTLLAAPEELRERRIAACSWWIREIHCIRSRLRQAALVSSGRRSELRGTSANKREVGEDHLNGAAQRKLSITRGLDARVLV